MDRRMLIVLVALALLSLLMLLESEDVEGASVVVEFNEDEVEVTVNGLLIRNGTSVSYDDNNYTTKWFKIKSNKIGYLPYRTLWGASRLSDDFTLQANEVSRGNIKIFLEPIDYTISFDDTFGNKKSLSCKFGNSFEVPSYPLLNNGYLAEKWRSGVKTFNPSEAIMIDESLVTLCDVVDESIIIVLEKRLIDFRGRYILNGGIADFVDDVVLFNVEDSVQITEKVPIKDGSKFKHWIIGNKIVSSGGYYTLDPSYITGEDCVIQIEAQWYACIIPNLEHCTTTMDSEVVDYGIAWSTTINPHNHYRLPSEISSVGASYVLNPDGTATLSTNSVSCPISFSITATPIEHTVTFNSNGGSELENLTFNEIETKTFPTPTNGIYEFNGWFNGGNKIENTAGLTNDITVVAKWTPMYRVNFYDDRGGTLVKECTTKGSVTAPTNPTKSGYQFTGWSSTDGVFTGTVSKDTEYYAQWSAIYVPPTPTPVPTEPEPTVTFYLEEGGDVYMKCTASELEELPKPTIEGYAFDYWYQRVDDEILEEFTGEFDEDIDVYAHWTAIMNRYHLYEGGDTWFEGYVCFERPIRDGYEFDSWYIIKDDQKVQFTEGLDQDVYASWKEKVVSPSSDGKINLILPIVAISLIVVMILGFVIYQKRLK